MNHTSTKNVINIAILGSTKGTGLQYIIDAINANVLPHINIAFVLSNKKNSGILQKAENASIPFYYHPTTKYTNNTQYNRHITDLAHSKNVDYIFLIGWMKILSPEFVKKWYMKCINIHPSLLPAFAGTMNLSCHKLVLQRGCKITGATLMYIDENPDTGPIIDQKWVSVYKNDTPLTLKHRVQTIAEGPLLIEYLQNLQKSI